MNQPSLPEFRPLDPKAVPIWRISNGIGFGILLTLVIGAGFLLTRALPESLPVLGSVIGGVTLWALFMILWHPVLAYRASGYALDDDVLLLKSGVWWQVVHLLPRSRLQHVDLKSGPIERRFGLATLVLFTAGTHAAMLTLSGISQEEAQRLRDALLAGGHHDDGV
jgi:uncharacterized protein